MGDLDRDVKKFEDAAITYNEALLIQRRLMVRSPGNPTRMRALATMLDKLANIRVRLRQLEAARLGYEELVSLRRKLIDLAPSDIQAKRDLALALDHFGNTMRDLKDREGARKAFEEELAIDRRIYHDDLDDMRAMIDVTWTMNKVAQFLQEDRDLQAARPLIEEMIAVERRLLEREPQSKARHRKLLDALIRLATVLLDTGEFAAAKAAYGDLFRADERWLGVARATFQKNESADARADLLKAYGDAGWHGVLAGETKSPAQYMEQALALDPKPPWIRVNLGHAYLFLGRYADAKAMYLGVKDEKRSDDVNRTYANEITGDFALFRKLGLGIPEMDRIVRELKL
jgi:tetratricopeptide (TPR) repeat protein